MKFAILRCENVPKGIPVEAEDISLFLTDDKLIMEKLVSEGHYADSVVWTDKSVNWNDYDAALIRSTWDYIDRLDEFLEVLRKIEKSDCRLINSLEMVEWNCNKNYLFDLENLGIPVVPTYRLTEDADMITKSFEINGWNEAVIKPVTGGGGTGLKRFSAGKLKDMVDEYRSEGMNDHLIQPLIPSISSEGEWSFIYFNKKLSHVLIKTPAEGDYRIHTMYGGTILPGKAVEKDIEQADRILRMLPFDGLYVRLDLVRTGESLSVMEIELIEPVLYFDLVPEKVSMFTDALVKTLT